MKTNKTYILWLASWIFFLAFAIYAFTEILSTSNRFSDMDISKPYQEVTGRPQRILVILLDSARSDFMFSDKMPFTNGLREKGAWGISEVSGFPISILAAWAIFEGRPSNSLYALLEDFRGVAHDEDSIFKRLFAKQKTILILSTHCLKGAYGKYSDISLVPERSFLFSEFKKDADYLLEASYRSLKNSKWDFAVVQFITMDFAGHLYTPRSPEYNDAARLTDHAVQKLVELTDDRDLVLVTSEHGMDDGGFHTDKKRIVMETPFVMTGPLVRTGGPASLMQIDWAPTLSLMAGVSPFYDSPALPALHILNLPADNENALLQTLQQSLGKGDTSRNWSDLQQARKETMVQKRMPLLGLMLLTVTFLVTVIFILFNSQGYSGKWPAREASIMAIKMVSIALALGIFVSLVGITDYLSDRFPFSTNFIYKNSIIMAISLMSLIVFTTLLSTFLKKHPLPWKNETLLLMIYLFIYPAILLSFQPYNLLNWAILSVPWVGWILIRRISWLAIFGAVVLALLIRRLTYYQTFYPFTLPDRWQIIAGMLIVCAVFLWIQGRKDGKSSQAIRHLVIFSIPLLALLIYPLRVDLRAILILFTFPLVFWIMRNDKKYSRIWMAMWATIYLLGTSSSIKLATHIAILPLFLAVWEAGKGRSDTTKGILVSLAFWSLYIMPSNGFDFKMIDLEDRYIMGHAATHEILRTVTVIVSRYVLPLAVLIWGFAYDDKVRNSVERIVTLVTLPVILVIGVKMSLLLILTKPDTPWESVTRLTVLLTGVICWLSVIICWGGVALIARRFSRE